MTAPRHHRGPRTTRLEDRPEVEATGKRFHLAKLDLLYSPHGGRDWRALETEYMDAMRCAASAAEVYAVGRKKASIEYGHKVAARTKRQEGK